MVGVVVCTRRLAALVGIRPSTVIDVDFLVQAPAGTCCRGCVRNRGVVLDLSSAHLSACFGPVWRLHGKGRWPGTVAALSHALLDLAGSGQVRRLQVQGCCLFKAGEQILEPR